MRISMVLSLQHLCCSKIVSSFFNEVLPLLEVYYLRTSKLLGNSSPALSMDPDEICNMIHSKIVHKIKCLTSRIPLQKKMEEFIEPLFYEIEMWLEMCRFRFRWDNSLLFIILESIPRCWFPDGTLDREKSVKILFKNSDESSAERFICACSFCLLDDVLNIWNILPDEEKMCLRISGLEYIDHFIEWLDSDLKKDSQSFVSWSLKTLAWLQNVYILKYVLKTVESSVEKKRHLLFALTQTIDDSKMTARSGTFEVRDTNDIMRFGLSLMTKDEQQLIIKKCPAEVFRCIAFWPMRSNFFDVLNIMWPFLTEDAFCSILNMLLFQIRERKHIDELIIIFQKFWEQSPLSFKTFANQNWRIYLAMHFVLEHDFSKPFPREIFSDLIVDEFSCAQFDI